MTLAKIAALPRPVRWGTLFLVAALALRAAQFGNPAIHVDEQYYLLVGDRMWHGEIPFVDSWDRKPIGLFLIYAAVRVFGGEGIVQYQVLASVFAAATALVIALIATRIARPRGGLFAGLIYLIFLMVNGGDGGQAPVFYNLPVAIAAWCVVRAIERPGFDRRAFGYGCAALGLIGVAIQIKYSVVFEGLFFGLALLATAWRRQVPLVRIAAMAAAWVALALLPTALALGWYIAIGHGDAFVFTNFTSILLRGALDVDDLGRRIAKIVARMAPVALAALAGCLWRVPAEQEGDVRRFVRWWAIAALGGFIGFGGYHDHYALPLLVPFTVAAAPAFAWLWKPWRISPVPILVGLFGLIAAWIIVSDARWRRGTDPEIRALAAQIRLGPGECMFLFNGDPILYHLTGSPIPTAFHFPSLLAERRDRYTLGIDAMAELRRVMAMRPQYVVSVGDLPFPQTDPESFAFVSTILAREYRLAYRQRIGTHDRLIYQRAAPHPTAPCQGH